MAIARRLVRYSIHHKGQLIEGFGGNPLAARNDAMRKIREISPDDPRVQYLDNVIVEIPAKPTT